MVKRVAVFWSETSAVTELGMKRLGYRGERNINLYAPRFLCIGQAFRYSPENAFYIFNQQIYFII